MNRLPFIAAVTLAFVLAAIVLLEYRGAGDRGAALTASQLAPVRAEPPARLPANAASASAASLGAQVQTILDRPLFSPSRRPGRAAIASTELPRLAGIIIGPRGARAIFAAPGEDRAIIAGPGTRAGPYLVRAVGAIGVSVIGPDGPELLHPVYDHNPSRDGAAAGSTPSAPSILDLLRSHVQAGGGLRTGLLPFPPLQTAPGLQR